MRGAVSILRWRCGERRAGGRAGVKGEGGGGGGEGEGEQGREGGGGREEGGNGREGKRERESKGRGERETDREDARWGGNLPAPPVAPPRTVRHVIIRRYGT